MADDLTFEKVAAQPGADEATVRAVAALNDAKATEAAKREALAAGVTVGQITPTGADGNLIVDDVKAAEQAVPPVPEAPVPEFPQPTNPDAEGNQQADASAPEGPGLASDVQPERTAPVVGDEVAKADAKDDSPEAPGTGDPVPVETEDEPQPK